MVMDLGRRDLGWTSGRFGPTEFFDELEFFSGKMSFGLDQMDGE
jgi:hypothetical protein